MDEDRYIVFFVDNDEIRVIIADILVPLIDYTTQYVVNADVSDTNGANVSP